MRKVSQVWAMVYFAMSGLLLMPTNIYAATPPSFGFGGKAPVVAPLCFDGGVPIAPTDEVNECFIDCFDETNPGASESYSICQDTDTGQCSNIVQKLCQQLQPVFNQMIEVCKKDCCPKDKKRQKGRKHKRDLESME